MGAVRTNQINSPVFINLAPQFLIDYVLYAYPSSVSRNQRTGEFIFDKSGCYFLSPPAALRFACRFGIRYERDHSFTGRRKSNPPRPNFQVFFVYFEILSS